MLEIISIFIFIALLLVIVKIFNAHNVYEKILGFYFIFSLLILLILINSTVSFDATLDIVIVLFFLQLAATLLLLLKLEKNN